MTCSTTNVPASISDVSFWNSVEILINKPHVVNKRLWGSQTLFRDTFKCATPLSLPLRFERIMSINNIQEYSNSLYENLNLKVSFDNATPNVNVLLVELLPKTYKEIHAFQLVILNKDNVTASFYDVTPKCMEQNLSPTFSYSFKLDKNGVLLEVECG